MKILLFLFFPLLPLWGSCSWLDEVEETPFKYSGISWWRPPSQWTATTNDRYYGKYICSAFVIKSGDGSQTATWKVPVPEVGQYDL